MGYDTQKKSTGWEIDLIVLNVVLKKGVLTRTLAYAKFWRRSARSALLAFWRAAED